MTLLRAVLRGNSDRVTFDIGRSNAAGRPGPCGDMTFRQSPRPASGRSAVLGRNALVCRATAIKPDGSQVVQSRAGVKRRLFLLTPPPASPDPRASTDPSRRGR